MWSMMLTWTASKKVCEALPAFDAAHDKSGGRLLPFTFQNMRAVSSDIKGLLVVATKSSDALQGENVGI